MNYPDFEKFDLNKPTSNSVTSDSTPPLTNEPRKEFQEMMDALHEIDQPADQNYETVSMIIKDRDEKATRIAELERLTKAYDEAVQGLCKERDEQKAEVEELDESRKRQINTIHELRLSYSNLMTEYLERLAEVERLNGRCVELQDELHEKQGNPHYESELTRLKADVTGFAEWEGKMRSATTELLFAISDLKKIGDQYLPDCDPYHQCIIMMVDPVVERFKAVRDRK